MITHPEKILFPDDGITKGDLAAYYEMVASVMLPHIKSRPITMERYPAGIGKKGFCQKDVSRGFPAWLERVEVPKKDGVVHHPLITDERSLLWIANQNTITPHVWTSRAPDLMHPDVGVFDLDPSRENPDMLRAAAVAGDPFEPDLAAAIANLSLSDGLDALDALTAPSTPHRANAPKSTPKGKVPASRDFQDGSDGTRTRDLRRDRPAF